MEKQTGLISNIEINEATFKVKPASLSPSTINYFFGLNGTGKTTIAETIKNANKDDNTDVLLFNQEFVQNNLSRVKDNTGLKGVFVFDESNKKVNEEINKLKKHIENIQIEKTEVENQFNGLQKNEQKAITKLKDSIWIDSKIVREDYNRVFEAEVNSKEKYLGLIKSNKNNENISLEEFVKLYDELFKTKRPNPFPMVPGFQDIVIPVTPDVLNETLIDSSNTDFKSFIINLGSEKWFLEGHDSFAHKTGGKCPYCQRDIDKGFEEKVKKAFDDTYREKINVVKTFKNSYEKLVDDINHQINVIKAAEWSNEQFQKLFLEHLDYIDSKLNSNIALIDKKITSPESKIVLVDIKHTLNTAQEFIIENNKRATRFNELQKDSIGAKAECRNTVFKYFYCNYEKQLDEIAQHEKTIVDLENKKKDELNKKDNEIKATEQGILEKQKELKDTGSIVKNINNLLIQSAFTGFHLIEQNPNTHNIQIIRDSTGQPAVKLSEGEKNFIIFLYFYFLVKGTSNEQGARNNKIIIIDDPVTSLDSSALLIISALVRELITIAANNFAPAGPVIKDDYIKQIFVFSHNPYFFRDVTEDRLEPYEYVSFYHVTKANNVSNLELCDAPDPKNPIERINRTPVKNAYNLLWEAYNAENTNSPACMNTIRQILHHYFIETCKFTGSTLTELLLSKDNGLSTTDFNIIRSMISYLNLSYSDDFNYDLNAITVSTLKANFEKIFRIMKHDQHYDAMIKGK